MAKINIFVIKSLSVLVKVQKRYNSARKEAFKIKLFLILTAVPN
jgi:hypothetical protein